MSTAEDLAGALTEANDALVALALSCSAPQWATVVTGEDWPVGVVVHHCAIGHMLLSGWVEHARQGEDIVDTAAAIDLANAEHAERCAGATMAETVELLRRNGSHAAQVLRALSDEELARSVSFGPADGAILTVEQVAGAAARHPRSHLASVQAALR